MSRPPSVPVRGQPVGPRVPKQEFMRALGLDENKSEHEAHYRAMRVTTQKEHIAKMVKAESF